MKPLLTLLSIVFVFASVNAQEQNQNGYSYSAGAHELMFQPTAYTMPQGNSYFTDYEAVLLNFSYAVTNRTHIGAFSLFPITSDFINSFTLGVKQNYFRIDYVQAAAFGTWTPESNAFSLGNVISFGKPYKSFHVVATYFIIPDDDDDDLFEISYNYQLGAGFCYGIKKYFALIGEYFYIDNLSQSVFSFGARFHFEYTSWEIGGFRPFENEGDLILFPFIKGTYYFH